MNKCALVVGGSNGIGSTIVNKLISLKYNKIYLIDKSKPDFELKNNVEFHMFDLRTKDYSIFHSFKDIDTLIITAGFGRVAHFENLSIAEIEQSFEVNTVAILKLVSVFYTKFLSTEDFYCAIMGSIAGFISSPLFSVYGATKAALVKFIESVNVELEMKNVRNRILNVSPGNILGTRFDNGPNNSSLNLDLVDSILHNMFSRNTLFIPDYEKIYKDVLYRYTNDPHLFGLESYSYKANSNRLTTSSRIKVGYLSGTFDLFHIGHLNLLKKAKTICDYLVVGVHKDASHKNKEVFIPFDERVEILKSVVYVDQVIESLPEDSDVYNIIKYDYLFVGSDYKGSKRFENYEKYFNDKSVKIIYFDYTKNTSSTQIRSLIDNTNK